jgi:hypothetical protein
MQLHFTAAGVFEGNDEDMNVAEMTLKRESPCGEILPDVMRRERQGSAILRILCGVKLLPDGGITVSRQSAMSVSLEWAPIRERAVKVVRMVQVHAVRASPVLLRRRHMGATPLE